MNKIKYLSVFALLLTLTQCQKKEESAVESSAEEKVEVKAPVSNTGVDSLSELQRVFLNVLQNADSATYLQYSITAEQEKLSAESISDSARRIAFQKEFGFSLKEEKVYFRNIEKYLKDNQVDLSKIDIKKIESVDYNKADYSPVVLKEIIVPVVDKKGIEKDILFVAIRVNEKWYFTSEIGI